MSNGDDGTVPASAAVTVARFGLVDGVYELESFYKTLERDLHSSVQCAPKWLKEKCREGYDLVADRTQGMKSLLEFLAPNPWEVLFGTRPRLRANMFSV
jgi:hypothetical protein